jgi:hypothetical protein
MQKNSGSKNNNKVEIETNKIDLYTLLNVNKDADKETIVNFLIF